VFAVILVINGGATSCLTHSRKTPLFSGPPSDNILIGCISSNNLYFLNVSSSSSFIKLLFAEPGVDL